MTTCAGAPCPRRRCRCSASCGTCPKWSEVGFQRGIAAEDAPPLYYSDADPDGDFDHVDTADVDEAFRTWNDQCRAADAIIAAHSLDDIDSREDRGGVTLRWILIHMIEEYARHNGHADLIRECLDGAKGD